MEKSKSTWFLCLTSVLLAQCFLTCFLAMNSTASKNYTTDQSALLAFKTHITYDPLHLLEKNWSTTTSICYWVGVSCSKRHKRVSALNLPNMGLRGTIPPHIGNLSFLKYFNISNNEFQGHLPTELARLRRLKKFDMDNNMLSGSIPSTIFNVSSLEWISLTNNSLSGGLPEDLCRNRLPKLTMLSLSMNELYGQFPSTLGECRELQILSLYMNLFFGIIPRGIWNLTKLEELHLGENNLKGEIPGEISNLVSLKILTITSAGLTASLPSSFFNVSSLKYLDLSKNNLSGTMPVNLWLQFPELEIFSLYENNFTGSIPREFGNTTSLKVFDMSENILSGTIPPEIGNLGNLEYLHLSDNNLSGTIPSTIFNLSQIQLIGLVNTQLSGSLPPNIGLMSPNLQELALGGNYLSGTIPDSISNASQLTALHLSTNKFTGPIPQSLGSLENLDTINLGGNNLISDPSSPEMSFLTSLTNCRYLRQLSILFNPLNGIFPATIGNFSSSFELFDARFSEIKGNIPNEIGNLSNLAFLFLGGNDLTGLIPMALKSLSKLQQLEIDYNKLHGVIPVELCHLKNLGSFVMDANNLSGSLPTCLGNLTSLKYLYLGFNRLTSSIPKSLFNLKDLLAFNLSSNFLSESLPSELGNLKVAIYIDLSMNQFSGEIPISIGDMDNLYNLSLTHNRLQGSIPESFGRLISLEYLDLSHNNLSGVIPKSLEALLELKYFDVSFNRLSGEIPRSGPFANFTNQSFISNEALCGAPQLLVPLCHEPRKKRMLILAYVLVPIASILLAIAIIYAYIKYRKGKEIPIQSYLMPAISPRRISYHELLRATNVFSESNLLGTGSFSSVYKGILSDGTILAAKVFNLQLEGAFKSFDTECEILRNIRHRNLNKIISSCSNPDFKALVLEYMPNGTLDKWLYSHNYFLDMSQRLEIMIDVACALEYLHHGYSMLVVHCDLKPSNVLLDDHMVAHVSDFGIAKFLCEGEDSTQTKTIATFGYIAPEYGMEGLVSAKCDVYSYGIMLMETFTRKNPTDTMFEGDLSLKSWIDNLLPAAITQAIDANLLRPNEENYNEKVQCVSSIMELALRCSAESPEARMNMMDVLAALKKIRLQYVSRL